MNTIIEKIESFINWTGRSVAWLSLLLVIVTFSVVVLRYIFGIGSIALQESANSLHASLFLIGMAYTLQHNAHVRVDIIYSKLTQKKQALLDLMGTLLFLLPFVFFIFWISWQYVADSWLVLEGSREADGLPGVFLLKSLILVMATLLCLQAIVQIARYMQIISTKTEKS